MSQTNNSKEIESIIEQVKKVRKESEVFYEQLKKAQRENERYAQTFYMKFLEIDQTAERYGRHDKKLMAILEQRRHELKRVEQAYQEAIHNLGEGRKRVRKDVDEQVSMLRKKIRSLEDER